MGSFLDVVWVVSCVTKTIRGVSYLVVEEKRVDAAEGGLVGIKAFF